MLLAPMRYKDYVWPYNPAAYSIAYQRQTAVHKVPFGRYYIQDMGMSCRVIRGQGACSSIPCGRRPTLTLPG